MPEFELRGYEIHSTRMWQQAQIDMALDFMCKHGLNTLILHQNDLQDDVVFPDKYFDNDVLWEQWPVRRQGTLYRREYMSEVIRKAASLGIRVYFEIKEIYFCEQLLEQAPGLLNPDGTCCPTNPFWMEFVEEKMRDLFDKLPGLGGIIVSLGTRESMISMAANRCTCERCGRTDPFDWYTSVLRAMHGPIAAAGAEMVVRDFSYTRDHQNLMIDACMRVSDQIVVSLKCQPHDYFPTFPLNPEIGRSTLREYVEIDVWGQFAGMGVTPCSLVEMVHDWLRELKAKGVDGVWFRTDWELMNEASVHNSLCMVNLYAGAMFADSLSTTPDEVYQRWVADGIANPMLSGSCLQTPVVPTAPDAWVRLKAFTRAMWGVYEACGYIRGLQYLESDQPPVTLSKVFDIMTRIFGREEWVPGSSAAVLPTEENRAGIFAEKEEGVRRAEELYGILQVDSLGVPAELARGLTDCIDTTVLFARFCRAATIASYDTQIACDTRAQEKIARARASLPLLDEIENACQARLADVFYPYYVHARLSPRRMRAFRAHLAALLDAAEATA